MSVVSHTSPFEIVIRDWADFVNRVSRYLDVGPAAMIAYLYLGQGSAAWRLEPRICRLAGEAGLSEADVRERERIALSEFRSRGRQFLPNWTVPADGSVVAEWSVMQHYGAPTRLLDWTSSPYVAAYFAVESSPETDGAVWIVHASTVVHTFEEQFPDLAQPYDATVERHVLLEAEPPSHFVYFHQPVVETDSMTAQLTNFSVSPCATERHDTLIGRVIPEDSARTMFVKMLIPSNLKMSFLRQLYYFNVSARSLFPGVDGLGKSISELLRLDLRVPFH